MVFTATSPTGKKNEKRPVRCVGLENFAKVGLAKDHDVMQTFSNVR
jgi:hypothetical protein